MRHLWLPFAPALALGALVASGWAGLLIAVISTASVGLAAEKDDAPRTHDHTARDTLTVVEMNHGDVLHFKLKSGQRRSFTLKETSARIIEQPRGGIVYSFDCHLLADGEPLLLRRYVCSQETFYEPWVINGVRLWLSSSQSVFKLVPIRYPDVHHKLDADAVVVLQDATLPICPQPMKLWFPIKQHFIDVGDCYNGDDPWLGPYLGQACHVGLDINMPKGTPLCAPIDIDDHWIFSGDHRWRGVRRWKNGDVWGLQSHHVDKLLLEENTNISAGTQYAEGAGKGVGSHQHSHFEFRLGREVLNRGRLGGIEIDPWILFWQIFQTDKANKGHPHAQIDPLAPAQTGKAVRFSAKRSRAGDRDVSLQYYWAFGDGGWSNKPEPLHTFARAGVFPVTLVIDNGNRKATHTQHITIHGNPINKPAFVLTAPDEVSFRPRPQPVADVYGWPVKHVPHTVKIAAAPGGGPTKARTLAARNVGGGKLPSCEPPRIEYLGKGNNWLNATSSEVDSGDGPSLHVVADPKNLSAGEYTAVVTVDCPGALNPRQGFRVRLTIRPADDNNEVIVDDRDEGFHATPYFWVGHQFVRCPRRGFGQRYLTNGRRASGGDFVRFTPHLAAGKYEVLLYEQTPLPGKSQFPVRVRHAGGVRTFTYSPQQSRSLGTYEFAAGNYGFVEFHAQDSTGLIVADAMLFRRTASNNNK